MIDRLPAFLLKAAIFVGLPFLCGYIGFVTPLLFDRDVGGALAAVIGAAVGAIIGLIVAIVLIRRHF